MPQGPLISDDVRILAAKLHKEHPKWTNAMIRNEIRAIVHKRDKDLPKGWPSKYAIDRIMPDIRRRVEVDRVSPDPRNEPWTIQSMVRYPIPAEALPAVLQVWFLVQDAGLTLTIGQAEWVARLYGAIKKPENLWPYVVVFSRWRNLAEAAGKEDYYGHQGENLMVFSTMTGHKITRKEVSRHWQLSEQEERLAQEIRAKMPDLYTQGAWAELLGYQVQLENETVSATETSTEEAQDEGSDLLQSEHRGPRKGRNKPRKSA